MKTIKKLLSLILAVVILATIFVVPAFATTGTVWNKNFGGIGGDRLEGVIKTSDGSFVAVGVKSIGGTQNDAVIVKYNSTGTMLWEKNVGSEGANETFNSVVQTSDGGYIAVGETNGSAAAYGYTLKGGFDGMIFKFDASGNVTWAYNFGGSSDESFKSVAITSDGGIVVAGISYSTNVDMSGISKGGGDAIMVKYNSTGSKVWTKAFGGTGEDMFYSVKALSNGDIVAVGSSESYSGDVTGYYPNALIVKCDSLGTKLWAKKFGGASYDYMDTFHSVTQLMDGGILAVGKSANTNGNLTGLNKGGQDGIVVKYDSFGNIVWNKNIGGTLDDACFGVNTTPDGGFVMACETRSTNGDFTSSNGNNDGALVKCNSSGNVLWSMNFGGSQGEWFVSIATISNGEFVVVGTSHSTDLDLNGLNKGDGDGIIVRVDKLAPTAPIASANITSLTKSDVTVTATFSSDSFVKQYSKDGGTWSTYINGIVFSSNGTVKFRGQDVAGNYSAEETYIVLNIDKTAPTKPILTASTTKPTNSNIKITITYSEDAVTKQYKIGTDGIWVNYTEPIVLAENNTVYARTYDSVGNISENNLTITNIDTEGPAQPEFNIDLSSPYKTVVKINFDPNTASTWYKVGSDGDWLEYTAPITIYDNLTIYARAIDEAGNESLSTYNNTSIIKTDTVTEIVGTIQPIIITFTVPTDVGFTFNPNAKTPEESFVSTEFSLTNGCNAPLKLSISNFTTAPEALHIFTDVAPDLYTTEEWAKLNKTDSESKIALGILKQGSPESEAVYVVDVTEPIDVGEIKPYEDINFTFIAKHGNAFSKQITTEYKITWVLELN